jgi:hypothetical protein
MKANNGSHGHNAIWIMGDMVTNYAANFMMGILGVSIFKLAFGRRTLTGGMKLRNERTGVILNFVCLPD